MKNSLNTRIFTSQGETDKDGGVIRRTPVQSPQAQKTSSWKNVVQTPDKNVSALNMRVPRPSTIEETGLSEHLLLDLLLKHLHVVHVATIRQLSERLGLCGGIIQTLVDQAKSTGLFENRQSNQGGQMRYALTNSGFAAAQKSFASCGYLGRAPVPLSHYTQVTLQQTNRSTLITRKLLQQSFQNLLFSEELISAIGPALNSSKPVLIYGLPGVGKSYLCRHLNLLFRDEVFIPAAIEVNNQIIQVYDPQVHKLSDADQYANLTSPTLALDQGYDPRWHLCERPLLVTGGELTEDMLDINYDPLNRTYKAPLQLKANNGILLLDDLGRQKISPSQLFNRWIIPLEERRDFLSLPNAGHFEIPFELFLLFSTNLEPKTLVDDAFLRRLAYKIRFDPLTLENYKNHWYKNCEDLQLNCPEDVFNYLIEHHHKPYQQPFLPCYPPDLLNIISDQIKFHQLQPLVNEGLIEIAWKHYFVSRKDNNV